MRMRACLLIMLLTLAACGKKGPLVYPDMLVPAAPSDVTAQQAGNNIRLAFNLPSKDRSGRPRTDIAGVKIFRRDLASGQDPACTACTTDFRLFKKWFVDVPDEVQRFGSRAVVLDGGVQSGRSYTYSITAFTKDSIDGVSSAPVTVNAVDPPQPPLLQVISHPTEVDLELSGFPVTGVFAGYRIYRSVKGEPFSYQPHVSSPVMASRYTDVGLEGGLSYLYAARIIVKLPSGILVESGLSNQVEAQLKAEE